jgi:hypothetical protein
MLISWALLYPAGIIVGRYGKTNDRWILVHTTLQTLGTAGAISMGGTKVYTNGLSLFRSVHATLGFLVIAVLVIQVRARVCGDECKFGRWSRP